MTSYIYSALNTKREDLLVVAVRDVGDLLSIMAILLWAIHLHINWDLTYESMEGGKTPSIPSRFSQEFYFGVQNSAGAAKLFNFSLFHFRAGRSRITQEAGLTSALFH